MQQWLRQCAIMLRYNVLLVLVQLHNFAVSGPGNGTQVWVEPKPDGHLHTVTYTRCRIVTINSPDDEHMSARNM